MTSSDNVTAPGTEMPTVEAIQGKNREEINAFTAYPLWT